MAPGCTQEQSPLRRWPARLLQQPVTTTPHCFLRSSRILELRMLMMHPACR